MPIFLLCMSAELEEVTDFSAPADHEWCLDLKQSDSDEVKEVCQQILKAFSPPPFLKSCLKI